MVSVANVYVPMTNAIYTSVQVTDEKYWSWQMAREVACVKPDDYYCPSTWND